MFRISYVVVIFAFGASTSNMSHSFSLSGTIGSVVTRDSRAFRKRRHGTFASVMNTNENEELASAIASINEKNEELKSQLDELRENDFFRLYSCDMMGSCEYMPQELFECYSESCEIYPVDDELIPVEMKDVDANEHAFDLDDWSRWDMPSEDYYSTSDFPEEYTGYDGSEVWQFIHQHICFNVDKVDDDTEWKADFNKIVSGLHSSISAHIVNGIQEKNDNEEDISEEQWTDAEDEFTRRLSPTGENSNAIDNLYFGYMIMLGAVSKARNRLLEECASGSIDEKSAKPLKLILASPLLDDPIIGIASQNLQAHAFKNDDTVGALWEARMRCRDLMRIMNCVQCNKCRFHGKIQSLGLSAAMQILLGKGGKGCSIGTLRRVELAALMTTTAKFSTAVQICRDMSN